MHGPITAAAAVDPFIRLLIEHLVHLQALELRDSDVETAVDLLGQVLETRNKAYGENAPECADTYLYYGQLLFEQAQVCFQPIAVIQHLHASTVPAVPPAAAAAAAVTDQPAHELVQLFNPDGRWRDHHGMSDIV